VNAGILKLLLNAKPFSHQRGIIAAQLLGSVNGSKVRIAEHLVSAPDKT